MPAIELKIDLNITASVETIRAPLRENNLKACGPRKVPLLTIKHAAVRMKFAKKHSKWPMEKWRSILGTDESKAVLYGGTGSRTIVRRPRNEKYRTMYTKRKTVKHEGSSIMIWPCFSYYGILPIHWIKTIMYQHVYVDILQNVRGRINKCVNF